MRAMKSSEIRWVLMHPNGFLLSKYCLPNVIKNDPVVPTFRTRKQARQTKELLESYRSVAQVTKVRVEYWV